MGQLRESIKSEILTATRLAGHSNPTVPIHAKMELFISKLRELDLPSVPNILRLIAIPATVKLHKGFFPAMLRKDTQGGVQEGTCNGRKASNDTDHCNSGCVEQCVGQNGTLQQYAPSVQCVTDCHS